MTVLDYAPTDALSVLNLLSSACDLKILPPLAFPIISSQVFTTHPPANYSTVGQNSSPESSIVSHKTKVAIAIAVPATLILLLYLVILYWYIRLYNRMKQYNNPSRPESSEPPEPPSKPSIISKSSIVKSEPPPPWSQSNATVFHPTPRLQEVPPSYPPPRFKCPHVATQATTTRKARLETRRTSATPDLLSPSSSPSPRFPSGTMSRSSLQPAMRKSWKGHSRMRSTKSKVSFDISCRTPTRKKEHTGWKDAK